MASDFRSLSLKKELATTLAELGFSAPTPIQAEAIPPLLAGRDLMGQSETGSGKTAAFALPILERIAPRTAPGAPVALILCPTRELCAQVATECRRLARGIDGVVVVTATGGEPFAGQEAALSRGAHIVVGTPGRTLDHLRRETLDVSKVLAVVLDEADRMLDMGFEADMEKILTSLPESRQTAFFSATFPEAMDAMSRTYQRDPVRLSIADGKEPSGIRQLAISTKGERLQPLYWALGKFAHERAIVFCNFKASVDEVATALHRDGGSVDCLHGDLDQFHRDQVLARFRNGSVRILVATDVAGRGLDIDDLDLVINYELPFQPEVYVHRIGRTGRIGKEGVAISLIGPRDKEKLREIEALVERGIDRLEQERTGTGNAVLAREFARPAEMSTILISGGRKDKLRPGDILGALTGTAGGLDGDEVGKIEVRDRLTYVAVSKEVGRRATTALNRGRIKKKRFRATLIGAGLTTNRQRQRD